MWLNISNFSLGTQQSLFLTSNQFAYSSQQGGKAAVLDPILANELRTHHFAHGNGKWHGDYASMYKINYGHPQEVQDK